MSDTMRKLLTTTDKICTINNITSIFMAIFSLFMCAFGLGALIVETEEQHFNNRIKIDRLNFKIEEKKNEDDMDKIIKAAKADDTKAIEKILIKRTFNRLNAEEE